MRNKTEDYIKSFHMTEPGDGVLIGLSGGADSVCLLHLLWCLKKGLDIRLRAVHVHHGLRGEEADRDADFSGTLCRQFNLPFRLVQINAAFEAAENGLSVEEAGRQARYRILEGEALAWEKEIPGKAHIAMAHHKDDNAETILHNLFRGSGLKGLGGIAPVRGRIIRPLLWAERRQIIEYLEAEGLRWVEDSTNAENDYTRNRIRNELIPFAVREINAQAVQNILRAGERIGQADAYFEKQADRWLMRCGRIRSRTERGRTEEYALDTAALKEEEEILKGYIIRRALEQLSCPLKDITSRHIEDIIRLAEKETGKQLMLPNGIRAWKEYGSLRLRQKQENSAPVQGKDENFWSGHLKMRVFPCENPVDFPKNQYTKWFDYDKIKDTLSVRTRSQGDYITLPGGGRKTVKAYMIDEKIPREARDRIWLLAEGHHILWIVGRRISEYYKITEHTKQVLEVQWDGGRDSEQQDQSIIE